MYDAIEVRRWNLQRQMMLDKIEFDEQLWPKTITPSRTRPMPASGRIRAQRWRPELSDEFNSTTLEGITSGVLGRKWLFKQEDPTLWSLEEGPSESESESGSTRGGDGALILKTNCTGIETTSSANMMVQRPTSSYFTIETKLSWVGPCGSSDHGPAAAVPNGTGDGDEAQQPKCDGVEQDVDYMNDDIMPDSERLFLPSSDQCCAACASANSTMSSPCIYWSYIRNDSKTCKPGINCGRCYFKTNDSNKKPQKGVVSGHVVGRNSSSNIAGSGSAGIIARGGGLQITPRTRTLSQSLSLSL